MRLKDDPAFLSSTIAAVYDCVLRPSQWAPVLVQLAEAVGAGRAFLGMSTVSGQDAKIVVAHNHGSMEAVIRATAFNPMMPLGLVWPVDKALVMSRDYGLDAVKASRFYREFLRPRGDLDAVAFVISREGDTFGQWVLTTQHDRGPLTDEEAAGLELIAPHIRRAVEISDVLGSYRAASGTYQAALDQLSAPVLIVDRQRRVAFANHCAAAALERGDVFRLQGGRLRGVTPSAEGAIRRATRESTDGGAGMTGFESAVMGAEGAEHLVFAVTLDGGADMLPGQPEQSTLLVLRSPREDTGNPVAIAARTFGLTNAQVQVLAFLAQGYSPEEVAQCIGIKVATVRSHLVDLFGKTGTRRQSELVARTLSLASPLRNGAGP